MRYAVAALIVCSVALPAGQTTVPVITPEDLARRIETFARAAMADLQVVPGAAIAVVRGADTIYAGGFGFADVEARISVTPGTPFYTASMLKAFTGMTAAALASEGALDLDAPLTRYFPGLVPPADAAPAKATLRGLLSHDPGFASQTINYVNSFVRQYDADEMVSVLNATGQTLPSFTYANAHFIVAGHVIEKATGTSWQSAMKAAVLDPLGMRDSSLSTSAFAAAAKPYLAGAGGLERLRFAKTSRTMTPAGGIFTTVTDTARFVRAALNGGRIDGRQALPESAVRLQQTPQSTLSATFGEYQRSAYGLGLYIGAYDGDVLMHHFGGTTGYRSHMSWMPERHIGVVVFVNEGDDGARFADILANYAYDLLLGRDADARAAERLTRYKDAIARDRAPREQWRAATRAAVTAAHQPGLPWPSYAGEYAHARLGTLRVEADAAGLRVLFGDLAGPAIALGGHDFLVDWNPGNEPARWKFVESDGRITGFDWGGRAFIRK